MKELKGDFRDIFNGFMMALDTRKMFLGLCGIVATFVFIAVPTVYVAYLTDATQLTRPVSFAPHQILRTFLEAKNVILNTFPWWAKIIYLFGAIVFFLVIWSYFGVAIARIAGYEVAKDERIETSKAIKFAHLKFSTFFWAPVICVLGFLFFYICISIGGGVGWILDHIRIGAPIVAIFLPLALLAGFILVIIAIGTITSAKFFAPTIGVEGTDAFDAISRGFSYVFSKPWHYIWYQVVNLGYGYVCIMFVLYFVLVMCVLTLNAGVLLYPNFADVKDFAWGTILSSDRAVAGYNWDGKSVIEKPHPYGRFMAIGRSLAKPTFATEFHKLRLDHKIAGVIVLAYLLITFGLAIGYIIAFYISSQTLIYYLLRKKVDGIEMTEVYEEPEEEEKEISTTVTPTEEVKKEETPQSQPSTEEKKE